MPNKYNFIRTTDESVKDILLKNGLNLVESSNGSWVFLNNAPTTFDLKDIKNKITYTNIISM